MSDHASDCLVVGLGAVGTLLAGSLGAGGLRVTAVGRHLPESALGSQPFTVRQRHGETRALVSVFGALRRALAERPPAVLAIAVKSYDVEGLASQLADVLATAANTEAPPSIVSFTNGVGADELLAAFLPNCAVIPGTLTAAAALEAPGTVRVLSRGGFALASPLDHGRHSAVPAALLGALRRADLPTGFVTDGRSLKWSKLLLNMVGAAACAALDWMPHQVMAHAGLRRMEERAWREAVEVMHAAGIPPVDLPGYRVRAATRVVTALPEGWGRPLLLAAGRGRAQRAPGTLADLRRGRRQTEVEWLHGAVADHALRRGLVAPVNTGLASVVAAIAAGEIAWDDVRGRPEVLLRMVSAHGNPTVDGTQDDEITTSLEPV